MLKNRSIRTVALILLLIFLLVGMIHLFILRFQAGDIYPAYSSLRSDPLGTRALYDSLENLNEFAVQRNFHFMHSLKIGPDMVLFYLGVEIPGHDMIPERISKDLDRLTESGGRLVISYLPVNKKIEGTPCTEKEDLNADQPESQTHKEIPGQNQTPEKEPTPEPQYDSDKLKDNAGEKNVPDDKLVSIREHWGFGFSYIDNLPVQNKDQKYLTLEATSLRPDLPAAISWHTNLYFKVLDDSWQTLYSVDDKPVIIERPMGKGTLVLCADSFFISNEALRSERHPQLLVWLLGRHKKIIFDESHFGIYQHPGVAGLLRHYRFHWFFGALTLLALLFVWKSAVYFVPPRKQENSSTAEVVSEKDYTQGLIALLRRNISGREILQVCGHEWEQTFKKDKRIKSGAVEHMKSILQTESNSSKKKSDPVTAYRKISSVFKRIGIYT
ncbi:hypothetical protein D1BOALGB6SA_9334 [Olavius sp. associated proteobacterium Delta 1]|nr:hypothetical protein D1BOALGB6SA_9334 [Olavius sp. associated proteobacterium Delta 1]